MIPLIMIGVVLAIGFAVLAAYLQAPSVRGKRGEKRVRTVLGETQEGIFIIYKKTSRSTLTASFFLFYCKYKLIFHTARIFYTINIHKSFLFFMDLE